MRRDADHHVVGAISFSVPTLRVSSALELSRRAGRRTKKPVDAFQRRHERVPGSVDAKSLVRSEITGPSYFHQAPRARGVRDFIGRTLGMTPLVRMTRGPGYAVGLERWAHLTPVMVGCGRPPSSRAVGHATARSCRCRCERGAGPGPVLPRHTSRPEAGRVPHGWLRTGACPARVTNRGRRAPPRAGIRHRRRIRSAPRCR